MPDTPKWRRSLEPILSIGSYPGEPEIRRGGRRVFILAFILATFFSMPQVFADLNAGYTWVAVMSFFSTFVLGPLILVAIWFRPRCFETLVTLMFVVITASLLIETAMFGGLLPSGLVVIFGLTLATRCHDRHQPKGGNLVVGGLRCFSGLRSVGPQLGGSHLRAVEPGSRRGLQPDQHRHPHHRGPRVLRSPAAIDTRSDPTTCSTTSFRTRSRCDSRMEAR
jgi:hypothetical protein